VLPNARVISLSYPVGSIVLEVVGFCTVHFPSPLHGSNVSVPKNKRSLIFVTFRGCPKNFEIKDFWLFGIVQVFYVVEAMH